MGGTGARQGALPCVENSWVSARVRVSTATYSLLQ